MKPNLIKLEQNYRSDISICTAAQRLISCNQNRLKKRTFPISSEPGRAVAIRFECEIQEQTNFAKLYRELPGTTAVLLKTNKLVDEWKNVLTGFGLPVATREAPKRPADWKLAKTALALLNDPENDWLAYWVMKERNGSEYANAKKTAAAASRLSINRSLLQIPSEVPIASYSQSLARLGVSAESITLIESTLGTRDDLLTGTDVMRAIAESENETVQVGDGIVVSTIHGAKGKEFDSVFLPAFEQEIIPGASKSVDIEENRRMAYVAMTRARHNLIISYCASRKPQYGAGGPIKATVSQFVEEAGL